MSEPTSHHPLPGQFRLTRLQLVNWGTVGGYKDIPIDPRGVLFTGHSGSGKSCLLDAYSLSLLPTYDQNFNASSDRTARGTKQASRTLVDYVRGAWSESNDENEQSEKRYLRGAKPTWSAVAATYEDGHGSVTTAVVVKWFTGTSNDVGSLNTTHLLHDDHLSLGHLDEWAQANFARNWFSKNYPGARYDSQTDYLREFSRRIGLGESNTAQSLLGKAKAMKNVGDLNQFIRTNMLDEPATGVDYLAEHDLYDLLESYQADSGATIVMVTHDLSAARYHASKVLVLNRRVHGYGSPDVVMTEECLEQAFGHRHHSHALSV